jgi:ABC-type Mn2+/Zn2+ transport system permease subunit
MTIFYIILCSFFGYVAGACAQGMNSYKYGWKKDVIVLIFLLASFYFGVVLVGYVKGNPL